MHTPFACQTVLKGRFVKSAVLHRTLAGPLPTAVRGDGVYLIDSDGQRYLDASGGAAVSCLGHNEPRVRAAIVDQLGKVEFAHTSFFTNEPSERLAEKLISLAPDGFGAGRVAFVGSGSEAMEVALKLARQYHVERGEPRRTHFVAREMSYHGNTLGALAIGGHRGRRAMYQPLLMAASFVSPCHPYRYREDGESDAAYVDRLADELDAHFRTIGPETIAAFVAEPIVGATLGSVPPAAGYFNRVRALCDRYGILFIGDEVMCGMGRAGRWFAIEDERVRPDIITIAKGLGAGFQPIGAVLASAQVVGALEQGSGTLANGHTYMSHAVACAAALAVIDVIEDDNLLEGVQSNGTLLESALRDRFDAHRHVGDIRGRGMFWSLELVADRATKRPFPARLGLAPQLRAAAMANGLICYPSSGTADGIDGDHVLLAPPFTTTAAQIDEIVDRLAPALDTVLKAAMVMA